MDTMLVEEHRHLLRAFADGGKKSYMHICRHLHVPVTPLAPSETRALCAPLVKAGLIERSGLLGSKYRITARGRSALADQQDTWPNTPGARATRPPADPNAPARPPHGDPADDLVQRLAARAAAPRPGAPMPSTRSETKAPRPEAPAVTPVEGSRGRPLLGLWAAGLVTLFVAVNVLMELGRSVNLDPPWLFAMLGFAFVAFGLAVGTTRILCGQPLAPASLLPLALVALPVCFLGMMVATAVGQSLGGSDIGSQMAVGGVLGILVVSTVVCVRTARAGNLAWVTAVGGERLGEPDVPREKSVSFAYLLLTLTGVFGGHRYYLGLPVSALLYTCTLGLLLIGTIVDFFLLPKLTRRANQRIWMAWFERPDAEWVTVEGTVRDLRGGMVLSHEHKAGAVQQESMDFRVEEFDANGDIIRRVPVEVVGRSFSGSIREGDTVRLTGRLSAENIVRTLAVDNVSTGSRLMASFL